jgi:transposase
VAASESRIDGASRGSCGCFAAAHARRIFLHSTRRLRRAGGDCRSGRTRASGSTPGEISSENSTRRASCRGTRRSATACSRQQQRGDDIGKTKRGKGTKLMMVADGRGVPMGVRIAPASPAEVTLIESTLEQVAVPRSGPGRPRTKPRRLIYDKAADSDALRLRLKKYGIELICPHRSNRKRPSLQDGRSLRRYRRRWTIERTVAWLENFRRLVVRYERKSKMFLAILKVACLMITLRQF